MKQLQYTCVCLLVLFSCRIMQAQNIIVNSSKGDSISTVILNNLVGDGVYVYNIKFNNKAGVIPYPQIGTFDANGYTKLQMDSGLVITTGKVSVAVGPNNSGNKSDAPSPYYSDTQLSPYASSSVTDCGTIDFDFVSISPFVTVNYSFGSEEYPEYVCSSFNDVFAFLVTGTKPGSDKTETWNAAIIPHTVSATNPSGIAVAINSVNQGMAGSSGSSSTSGCYTTYSDFYVVNHQSGAGGGPNNSQGVQYDGFTQKLSANATLIPCQEYHMHISVCNVGDNAYDSGVFLEHGSFNSPSADVSLSHRYADTIERSRSVTLPLTLAESSYDIGLVSVKFGGTAKIGTDYTVVTDSNKSLSEVYNTFIVDKGMHGLTFKGIPTANLNKPLTIELFLQTSLCTEHPELKTFDTIRYVLVEDDLLRLRHDTIVAYDTCFQVGVEVALGTPPYTFHWMPEDDIDFPYQQVSTATITESRLYQVAAADAKGHTDTTDIYVQVLPKTAAPDVQATMEASVYPNPTDGPLHIDAHGTARVEVYSTDGTLVRTEQCDASTEVLRIDGLQPGLYTLRIVTPARTHVEKVVVY